jgi:hypothetical protein
MLLACALLCRPAWPVGFVLTHDELMRLLKVVDQRGSRTTIPRSVASVLQLKSDQLEPDVKQAAYLDDEGNRHGFAKLNDGSSFFMFSSGAALGQTVYVVDKDLHLVKAARSLLVNGPLIPLPEAEGQKELEQEFSRWSKLLSPGGQVVNPFKPPGAASPGAPVPAEPYPFKKPDQKSL